MKKNNWCYYRFRIEDSYEESRWWLDLFIINEIIAEIIEEYKPYLWRFHRRAVRDNAGHQISLICYTDRKEYKKINKHIKNMKAFKFLFNSNILRDYVPSKEGKNINGTSDRHWCEGLKSSWPFFIQGVSKTFLELLKSVTDDYKYLYDGLNYDNILNIEELYTKVDKKMESIWYYEGGHAFFHHLNAIFGYKNVKTKQTLITAF